MLVTIATWRDIWYTSLMGHTFYSLSQKEYVLVCMCNHFAVMRGEFQDHWDLAAGPPTSWLAIWMMAIAPHSAPFSFLCLPTPLYLPPSYHPPHLPQRIPSCHSTSADLLILFHESQGSLAPEWSFHSHHPTYVALGFKFWSWRSFRERPWA